MIKPFSPYTDDDAGDNDMSCIIIESAVYGCRAMVCHV